MHSKDRLPEDYKRDNRGYEMTIAISVYIIGVMIIYIASRGPKADDFFIKHPEFDGGWFLMVCLMWPTALLVLGVCGVIWFMEWMCEGWLVRLQRKEDRDENSKKDAESAQRIRTDSIRTSQNSQS